MKLPPSIAVVVGFLLILALPKTGRGQVLSIDQILTEGDTVRVLYTVPFDGYVQLDVYNAEDRHLGHTAFVVPQGQHTVRIARARFKDGDSYTLEFTYKGKKYSRSFINEF